MEKYLFSQKFLRAHLCIIALGLGCLFPNIGYCSKNISTISLRNSFATTFKISIASNIVYAEYFIDDDPGFGKGISIPITSGASIEHTFSVSIPSTLSNGLHTITVRYKDALGNWSISSPRSFMKDSLISTSTSPNITYAEYFIDDDLGFGKGTSIPITAKSGFEHAFSVLLPSNLSNGLHVVTVRYKDALGNWSISSPRSFIKENLISTSSLPNLVYVEYFIDDAPAFGKGTPINITASNGFEHSVTIPLASTLNDGLHVITVRYKDALGNWSISSPRSFIKESLISSSATPNIVYAEYFINDDPGFGKGTAISITASNSFEHSLNISIPSTLSEGLHLITVRYKDALGNWSISSARAFIKENPSLGMPLPELVYAEYFIDDDPGLGKGKTVNFKAGQTIQNLLFDINLNNLKLANGQHFLQLRVKDAKNVWSTVGTKTFVLSNELARIALANVIVCSTGSIQIPYIVEGIFDTNNQFKIELSDEKGEFPTNPKVLGSITSKVNSQIPITISDVSLINKYKIRIVSTNPIRQSDAVNLISKPFTPAISVTSSVICQGSSAVLTASACENGTLTWTGGLKGNAITVNPTKTTTYKALCTVNTCKSDSSLATTITVTPKPIQPKITANNTNICVGGSSVLASTACTGGTLTWTGGLTGNSITVSPTKTRAYKVLCTIGSCKSDSSLSTTITVIPKPTQPKITASNSNICAGGSSVLASTACTGGTLTWTGGLTGNSITVSPTVTKAYKVLCTIGGCKSDSSLATTVTVISKPIQSKITASNTNICAGGSSVLTATACTGGTLTWTGGLTGNSITVSPTSTRSYKVLCPIGGCKSDSSLATTVTVIPKPAQPKITASNTSICAGGSSVLTSTACTNGVLTWTGGLTGTSITVSPTATKSYKALCTINGCKSDSSLATTITVVPKPIQPKITASNSSICVGGNSVLTSTACVGGTLTWTGGLTGNSITVSPTSTRSYKALCTINGCKSDSSLATTITVIPKPTQPKITASNATVCAGSSSILTSTACVGGTLTWTGGLTGSSITVSSTATKSYKVLCTIGDCKSDSSLATTITVVPKPIQPKITASNSSICVGGNSVLTSTACTNGTLTWTGGLTGNSITVSPTATKSYKALCTVNGCKSDSSLATTITVIPKAAQPKITASNATVCAGSSSILTSTACVGGTLTWTGGLTGSSITVSPTSTKSYKVLCTIGGCKSDSSLATTIMVVAKPTQPKITASNSSICVGGNSVLTSTACVGGTLTWTGGLTGNSITVSPTSTRSYKALCTIGGCKSDSSLATTITVVPKPIQPKITASNSSICVGGSSVLTSTACVGGTLTWTGGLTGNSITVSPTVTKSYKALCTVNGCKSDSSLATTITVVPKPS